MGENIQVACRVRPLNSSELSKGDKSVVAFPGDGKSAISLGASQLEVYDTVAKPIIHDVLNGYNGTIFAYGQTSSGKTFTMEGVLNDNIYKGIIPRIIFDIFNHIYTMDENLEFHIKVSYFEIYLDKIRDLLDVTKTNLSVHEDKDRVPYVKGATERFVSCPTDVFDLIDEGKANRHVAVTNMNEHSSRSHSIFMITLRQEHTVTNKKLHGKLYLVDLAGSEKVAKTGAEGTVLDEAKNINKSLSALGNVINSLVEGNTHVPYRDSKLTRILQESLGGNARTTMVICCSPASFNEGETKSTLMFGMRAKTIKNCVTVNEELTADEWRRRYEKEKERSKKLRGVIAQLETELEKWRGGQKVEQSEWFVKENYANAADVEETAAPNGLQVSSNSASDGTATPISTNDVMNYKTPTPAPRPQVTPGSGINEEQVRAFYQQLDDKDEELDKQGQIISCLKEQLEEQEELLKTTRKEKDNHLNDISRLEKENEASKEEIKEVLQALEELAMNFDQKELEIAGKTKELEETQESLNQRDNALQDKESEFQQLKDSLNTQKKKSSDILMNLLKEISELGTLMNENLTKPLVTGERLDEEFTVIRLFVSKMKAEAKATHDRIRDLEEASIEQNKVMTVKEDEGRTLKTSLQEYKTKLTNLETKLQESDSRKRELQETIDQLNTDLAVLRANEQLLSAAGGQQEAILAGQGAIHAKLDEEMKRQGASYTSQIKELRDELHAKEKSLESSTDMVNHLQLEKQSLTEDRDRAKEQYEEIKAKLETLEKSNEIKEKAQKDLRGVEETVKKELQVLNEVKANFIQDLHEKIRKSKAKISKGQAANTTKGDQPGQGEKLPSYLFENDSEDVAIENSGSIAQKTKIAYLETNLTKLSQVHKNLLRNKAEMRVDLIRLEKRHKSSVERVAMLESALKEAKDGALRDRKRYNHEIERIRDVMRTRSNQRRRPVPQIATPIRAGHTPSTASHGHHGGNPGQSSAIESQQPSSTDP